MTGFPSNLNVHLALEPQNLRKSFSSLTALVGGSSRAAAKAASTSPSPMIGAAGSKMFITPAQESSI
jgi:hypothetical protein